MTDYYGYGVRVELKDGKLIQGKIAKATSKGLTLNEVRFGDGGTSQAFKVRASRLKDLKVLSVGSAKHRGNNNSGNSSTANNGSPRPQSGQNADWKNDDVAGIKKQDDFDFQSSLKMFNKKDIFAQLKQQDEINPDNRLVSHNKKQGTKQDKYDIDELVLPDAKDDAWDTLHTNTSGDVAIAGEGEEDDDDDDYDEDDVDNDKYFPVTKSINITHLLHSASSKNPNEDKSSSGDKTTTDELLTKLGQMIINQSATKDNESRRNSSVRQQALQAKDIKLTVPMATAIQLWEIQRVTSENYGITSTMTNENFAVNASNYIKQKLGGRARLRSQNMNAQPLVIILTSESARVGARALAVGRHLCSNNYIRVITMFTNDINEIKDPLVKEQLDIYTKCGGKFVNTVSQLENTIEKLNSPVELVIDAMQDLNCNLGDLVDDNDNAERKILNMIHWCNEQARKDKQVWSIDIPSGYDNGSGLENFPSSVSATSVLSSGWPLLALPRIQENANTLQDVVVVDIGTPHAAYTHNITLRKFQNCDLFVQHGSLPLII
ncbi:hypothetical protein TPHA_0O00880 [Tetrapisispora phaffii CBS 4417]|uniref:Enhancer of mRNA-decapping protein 3 n=1 Tax=Tetrapisispora phaffii (strain ATCC 24235 / CBS 4417 / NBRC 1672 / NRRL Y-8282 / UCD 70-5) TaxID=1071381 RepID=G8C1M9_TETPH|nr:hypothetical protein TPHA_0O00880 [Tetrapisispora phaffii CBS 4417]CCE66057.1 hypothetical protein TPHA_0O00880 [Tetrapisispora phaffii CBS 4417]